MRVKIFLGIICASFVLLIAGLFHTQVVRGGYYKKRSEDNRIVLIPLEAPRGSIYDKNGRAIVDNRLSFDVAVTFRDVYNVDRLASFLAKTLGMGKRDAVKAIDRARARPYSPTVIIDDIGKNKAIMLEQERADYPGFRILTSPRREYLLGSAAAALTGYVGKINREELERYRKYGYTARDLMGRSGLEKTYDEYLRGAEGGMQVETDSRGRQQEILVVKDPEPGRSLYLTLDAGVQDAADSALGGRHGAIIVMEPSSGRVLAYVSHPGYDPNIFVSGNRGGEIRRILRNVDGGHPLLDRCISAVYPLGSVFKLIVGIAALDTGKFTEYGEFTCNGAFNIGGAVFKCWKKSGHGTVALGEALKVSCNVFFYRLGLRVGADDTARYAKYFGFGKKTGIDLSGEIDGIVPDPEWKRVYRREKWYTGDTVNFSIGQGYLLVTPMQVVRMIAAVGNGGYMPRPYVVEKIDNVQFSSSSTEKVPVSSGTLGIIKKGAVRVVNERGGTGYRAALKGVEVAGKTGTAQNPRGKAHGWFAGFAPADKPSVCMVVFVEYSGLGGAEASRIAHDVLEKIDELGYFS